jgi:hypothetical protein
VSDIAVTLTLAERASWPSARRQKLDAQRSGE